MWTILIEIITVNTHTHNDILLINSKGASNNTNAKQSKIDDVFTIDHSKIKMLSGLVTSAAKVPKFFCTSCGTAGSHTTTFHSKPTDMPRDTPPNNIQYLRLTKNLSKLLSDNGHKWDYNSSLPQLRSRGDQNNKKRTNNPNNTQSQNKKPKTTNAPLQTNTRGNSRGRRGNTNPWRGGGRGTFRGRGDGNNTFRGRGGSTDFRGGRGKFRGGRGNFRGNGRGRGFDNSNNPTTNTFKPNNFYQQPPQQAYMINSAAPTDQQQSQQLPTQQPPTQSAPIFNYPYYGMNSNIPNFYPYANGFHN